MIAESLKNVMCSFETSVNLDVFGHKETVRLISELNVNGKIVVIRNALKEACAERMLRCLDQYNEWKAYEQYQPHFHYHHHNIYDERLFPPDLALCKEIFQSDSTKRLMQH